MSKSKGEQSVFSTGGYRARTRTGKNATQRAAKSQQERDARRPDDTKPATYRIGSNLKERIDEAASDLNVEKSGLVKFLLHSALDLLDEGELTLPEFAPIEKPRKLKV